MTEDNKTHIEHSTGDFKERERYQLLQQERTGIIFMIVGVPLLVLYGIGLFPLVVGFMMWIGAKVGRWVKGLNDRPSQGDSPHMPSARRDHEQGNPVWVKPEDVLEVLPAHELILRAPAKARIRHKKDEDRGKGDAKE